MKKASVAMRLNDDLETARFDPRAGEECKTPEKD